MTAPRFTVEELAACARRELRQRKLVYRRRVDAGRMSAAQADREIAMMAQIAADYEARSAEGRLI